MTIKAIWLVSGVLTVYEIGFRLQHEKCPYNDLSRRHPEALIAMWCNWSTHVMEIYCKDLNTFQRIQDDIKEHQEELGKVIRSSFSSTNVQMLFCGCGCSPSNSITAALEKHNSLEIQPTMYAEGWERYRIISFSQKDVRGLFNSLSKSCKIEMLSRKTIPLSSVREAFVISANSLFGELTVKQSRALLAALERGYYRVPKKVTTDEIAQDMGLPRTTFEEHLRKAESKVFRAITPYIQMGTNHSKP
jgi:predicted DNA binding protein